VTGPGGKARVLLVDDDRSMLDALARMVHDCGHEPLPASTWSDALMLYRRARPDLVLLDVMMPTIDGYKLARMLKAEAGRFVPIILITGLDDLESKRRGMSAGADDFLTKPVAQLELDIRLNAMLRIKQLTDEIAAANARLAELATTDPLTRLANRRALYEHLDREFQRSQRYGNAFAVLLLDIDLFKRVNDTWGHAVGDRVLVAVSQILRETVRQTDVVGRYGGEEFLVLAPETPHASARVLAERVRARVELGAPEADDLPAVTVSVGVASSDVLKVAHFEELIQLADDALYAAKHAGRNRCEVAAAAPVPAAP
jgi:two-component system, chemotaxis family, response regulator WspR